MNTAMGHDVLVDQQALTRVCNQFHVRWLAVFGSIGRGEALAESDVDVLVEFEKGSPITYFELVDLAEALSPVFGGRKVDLGRPAQLHWSIRDRVLGKAKVLHAA